jgi:hypothetical protein
MTFRMTIVALTGFAVLLALRLTETGASGHLAKIAIIATWLGCIGHWIFARRRVARTESSAVRDLDALAGMALVAGAALAAL